jgi:peptidoglycan hydrolase-like protein with peptidoglycan-binding domain
VESLQEGLRRAGHLHVGPDGKFGPVTARAYIRWQQSVADGGADGIVTPQAASLLGFEL